jgi:hypothetical protein
MNTNAIPVHQRTKYAKRIMQNNEKFLRKLEDLNRYNNKSDKKSIEKVIAITLPGNSNSINLLEKLGLKYESSYFENDTQLSLYSIVF